MTPSQRTLLVALASGAAGFVVLFALGVGWPLAAGLGAGLALSVWFALSYLTPSDTQGELNDCFRQQRFPELIFTSDASIALTMYLARNANGAVFDAPSIKR